jgi:hypothetical protein
LVLVALLILAILPALPILVRVLVLLVAIPFAHDVLQVWISRGRKTHAIGMPL